MKTRFATSLAVALAATSLALLPAAAGGPRGCSTGSGGRSFSGNISNGNVSFAWNSGSYNRGYSRAASVRAEAPRPSFTERCKLIDTYYFTRGCDRYAKKTYLHERIDCHGHVVKCWKTYETVRASGHHNH